MPQTRTPKRGRPRGSKSGNVGTTQPTSQTLEQEAKQYVQKKKPAEPLPLTTRRFYAGLFGAAYMITSQGRASLSEIKRNAFDAADFFMEDET